MDSKLNTFQKKLVSFLVDIEVVSDPLAIAPNVKDIPKYEGKTHKVIPTPQNYVYKPMFTVDSLNLARGELDFEILSLGGHVNDPFGHSSDRERIRWNAEMFIQEEINRGADPIYIQELEQNMPR